MAPDEYDAHDATGLAELVATGQVAPAELLETAIARIERDNPTLNAVVVPLYEQARAAVAAGLPEGPFRGVPFLLKDLLAEMEDVPTSAGCRMFAGDAAAADSELVRRYKRAGLVILGKSNTSEFGLAPAAEPALFGPTLNPWGIGLAPGGSSGGAAAAVAAGMVPMAHATDGGGSIRIPAALCGLFGLKPSRGRISMAPFGETWAGAGTQHAVTRSVRDCAALLDAVAGPAPGDPTAVPPGPDSFLAETRRPPGRLRIAFSSEARTGGPVATACRDAVRDVAALLASLGHEVEEAAPDYDHAAFATAFVTVMEANTRATMLARARGRTLEPPGFEPLTWAMAERGARVAAADYIAAVNVFHRTARQVGPFFERWDAFLTPTLPEAQMPLGRFDMQAADPELFLAEVGGFVTFTSLFNATGQPAMSVPVVWAADGLPIGVQVAAKLGGEGVLLRLAAQLEEARPFAQRYPARAIFPSS